MSNCNWQYVQRKEGWSRTAVIGNEKTERRLSSAPPPRILSEFNGRIKRIEFRKNKKNDRQEKIPADRMRVARLIEKAQHPEHSRHAQSGLFLTQRLEGLLL